jgi:hypothetical protein
LDLRKIAFSDALRDVLFATLIEVKVVGYFEKTGGDGKLLRLNADVKPFLGTMDNPNYRDPFWVSRP